jgi:hypothetical protein
MLEEELGEIHMAINTCTIQRGPQEHIRSCYARAMVEKDACHFNMSLF